MGGKGRTTALGEVSHWPAIRGALGKDLSAGGRRSSRWIAGGRASVLVNEKTYQEALARGVGKCPDGQRRRVMAELLDDGQAVSYSLDEVGKARGKTVTFGGVRFPTTEVKLLREMGERSVYVAPHHMRTAPIGGSIVLAANADPSIMSRLSGWILCECCRGRGWTRVEG